MSRRLFDRRLSIARVSAHVPARTLVAAAVAAALASGIAQAQEAAAPAGEALTEITVTGSRIVRRDLEAASPVVTVENKAFQESSTIAVESVLNQLPQYVPTTQTQFNTSDVFPSATSTPGVSSISLRGLGANRTLVLIDGRRAQPTARHSPNTAQADRSASTARPRVDARSRRPSPSHRSSPHC
jgi:outer membrane receptor for ferrienterochelin and colicin